MRYSIARQLQKYSWITTSRRQQENFLTELLGGALNSSHLLKNWFLSLLEAAVDRGTNPKQLHLFINSEKQTPRLVGSAGLEIETQYTFDLQCKGEGKGSGATAHAKAQQYLHAKRRPDIKVAQLCDGIQNQLYFVECKLDAGWGSKQAEEYSKGWRQEAQKIEATKPNSTTVSGGVVAITRYREQFSDQLIQKSDSSTKNTESHQYLLGGLTWQELAISLTKQIAALRSNLEHVQEFQGDDIHDYVNAYVWAEELLLYLKEEVSVVTDPILRAPSEIWTDANITLDVLKQAADNALYGRGVKARYYRYFHDDGICIGWQYRKGRTKVLLIFFWGSNTTKDSGLYFGAYNPDGSYKHGDDTKIPISDNVFEITNNSTQFSITNKADIIAEQIRMFEKAIENALKKNMHVHNIDALAPREL